MTERRRKLIKKGLRLKYLFWFFYFVLMTTLCADGDNGRVIYFSTFMLFAIAIAMNIKMSRTKLYQATNVWYFFFWIFGILSIIWSIRRADSYGMTRIILRQFAVIIALGLGIDSIKNIHIALKIYLVSCTIMMLKISIYMARGYSGSKMWDAICGNYFNTVAQILALSIAVALYLFQHEVEIRKKALYIIYAVFAFYHIIATGSRKGLIMPLVAIGVYLIVKSGADLKKIIRNILIFIAGAVVLGYVLMQNEELAVRLNMVVELILQGNAVDESSVLRMAFIQLAKEMFITSPLLGCGLNTFASQCLINYGRYYYAHNNFFELLSGVGIVGFVSYYWLYAYSIYKFYVMRKKHDIYILGLSVWLTLIFFEYGIVTYSVLLYPILLTILAISYRKDIELEEKIDVS